MENKKTLNIILSNATVENGNQGCVALCYSSIFIIDKILAKLGIPYKLFIAECYNKAAKSTLRINDHLIEYQTINIPYIRSIKSLIKNILYYRRFIKSFKAFSTADILLDVGEGDSFSDIYGFDRFHIICQGAQLAKKQKLPYFHLPQTIGPFSNKEVRKRAIKIMESSLSVMARDKQSAKIVNELSPSIKTNEYIDMAFLLPYSPYKFDDTKIHIGLNVSGLLWHGGYTCNNQFGLKADYIKAVRTIANNFLQHDPRIQIHLISHVFTLAKDNVENDFDVMTNLYKEFNNSRITLAPLSFNPIDVKSYIAGMDFFIGARMHATIAAFSSGVPVVPMAYSRKFNGLFVDTLAYPHLADLKCHNEDEIASLILNAYDNRNSIRDLIKNRMNSIVEPRLKALEEDVQKILLQALK